MSNIMVHINVCVIAALGYLLRIILHEVENLISFKVGEGELVLTKKHFGKNLETYIHDWPCGIC